MRQQLVTRLLNDVEYKGMNHPDNILVMLSYLKRSANQGYDARRVFAIRFLLLQTKNHDQVLIG